jgi:alcohol dehydrogenase (cytochrome c)
LRRRSRRSNATRHLVAGYSDRLDCRYRRRDRSAPDEAGAGQATEVAPGRQEDEQERQEPHLLSQREDPDHPALDPQTGRPEYDMTKKPLVGQKIAFCPSLWGGKDWPPAAYNPNTRYLYIPANENLCGSLLGRQEPYQAGKLWLGVDIPDIGLDVFRGAGHVGELQAWDMTTGKRAWTKTFKSHNWGPVLTTGGGLVFMGGTNDRYFRAFDARTGEVVWEFRTNSGITGVPSTYMVDGVQYVAVQSGWGVDAQRMQESLDTFRKTKTEVPQGGVIWVFALRE